MTGVALITFFIIRAVAVAAEIYRYFPNFEIIIPLLYVTVWISALMMVMGDKTEAGAGYTVEKKKDGKVKKVKVKKSCLICASNESGTCAIWTRQVDENTPICTKYQKDDSKL